MGRTTEVRVEMGAQRLEGVNLFMRGFCGFIARRRTKNLRRDPSVDRSAVKGGVVETSGRAE